MEAALLFGDTSLIHFGMPKACGCWRGIQGLFLFRAPKDVRSIFACHIDVCRGCSMEAALLEPEDARSMFGCHTAVCDGGCGGCSMEAALLAETHRLINFGMPKACGYSSETRGCLSTATQRGKWGGRVA